MENRTSTNKQPSNRSLTGLRARPLSPIQNQTPTSDSRSPLSRTPHGHGRTPLSRSPLDRAPLSRKARSQSPFGRTPLSKYALSVSPFGPSVQSVPV